MKPHPNTKHGHARTPTHRAWLRIRSVYKTNVTERWDQFASFLEDMGEKPPGTSLRRLKGNGLFCKENCHWVVLKGENCPRFKHGHEGSSTYGVWCGMLSRTLNPNNRAYPYYGGRGISVCEEWKTFEGFYKDMGERPSGMSLERIDNNAGYCKENCKWAAREEQARNRRNVTKIELDGQKITLPEIVRMTGIPYHAVYHAHRKNTLISRISEAKKNSMIAKNIPLPQKRIAHADVAKAMAVGDSALFTDREKAKGLQSALKKLGRDGCIRKTDQGQYRVWRTA